jgi:serine/threonine protein kinase
MTMTAGQRLGAYEILSLLGSGGMGEVYRARDTRLDRIVAIKVLPAHLADRLDLRERLEREARAVSSLNHPHICTLYDIGEHDVLDRRHGKKGSLRQAGFRQRDCPPDLPQWRHLSRWSRDGKELFFLSNEAEPQIMAVKVRSGPQFQNDVPVALFRVPAATTSVMGNLNEYSYAVSPDGRRFLVNVHQPREVGSPIRVLLNWKSTPPQ